MKYCSKCKNPIKTRKKILDFPRGPFGSPRFSKETEEYCGYCEWKGDTGAGAALKSAIKRDNNKLVEG